MKNTVVWLMLVTGCLSLAGCSSPGDASSVYTKVEPVKIVDYGNGVYYFDSKGADFANDLSAFLRINQDLEVSSTVGEGKCAYGINCGYFVTFRKKK